MGANPIELRRRLALAALLAVLAVAVIGGCGDDGNGSDQTNGAGPATINGDDAEMEEAGGYTGVDARNYESAKEACGQPGFLPEGATVRRAAKVYATVYPPDRKEAVIEGCLAGLEGE